MFIEKTAFEARVSNDRKNDLCNITGHYQVSGADADCSAGLLCVRKAQLPCAGFPNVLNDNAWYMEAATAAVNAGDVIYACNTYDTQLLAGPHGTAYHVGTETLGLGIPAGRDGTFTKIVFEGDRRYRFGVGNANAELGSNKYLTIEDGMLKPVAAAPTANGALYFKVTGTGNFTEGTSASFGYIEVEPHVVVSAVAAGG
nr:MAG TPA: hypothetical protein [Caudoviricetes sp.]